MMPALTPPHSPAINGTDAQLVWELVAQISPTSEVLARYGLTPQDLRSKLKDRMFRSAYREARTLWHSDMNVEQRIRLKAKYMIEDSILDLFKILKDPNTPSNVKLEAFSTLAKVAELTNVKKDAAESRPFSIAINFQNHPSDRVIIDGHALDNAAAEA